jgi:glycosyltransferase involved in cell wall biosynthesis
MSSSPLISICLPLYNGARHLPAAIDSILAQSCRDFELLIADDGSEDGSAEIAAEYAGRDPRIVYWKNEKRQGLFGNYNACQQRARARYIKPFAQDDLLQPDALATMVGVLENEPQVALVSSAREIIDDAGAIRELKQPIAKDFRAAGRQVIQFHLIGLNNWVGEPSTVMFRADHAGQGFDASYYHYGDIEYWFRILRHGDFFYFSRPLSSFRRHAESQTDKNHRQLYFALDILRLSLAYRNFLADIEPEALLKRRLSEKIALEHEHVLDAAGEEDLFAEYQKAFLSPAPDRDAGPALTCSQAAGFRLLSSITLSVVSELIKELDHEKRCRHDEHERFVAEVDKMQRSIYWKLTNPLRKVRDLIKERPVDPNS